MDVQLVLLRALMGMGARPQETALRPGVTLGARVLPDGGLLLAGVRVQATLPENLAPGSFVRLQVKEATTERLLLQVVDANAAPDQAAQAGATAQAAPMPTFPVLLPGPAMAHLLIDPEAEGEEGGARGGVRSTVTLRYESEGLGRVDLARGVAAQAPPQARDHELEDPARDLPCEQDREEREDRQQAGQPVQDPGDHQVRPREQPLHEWAPALDVLRVVDVHADRIGRVVLQRERRVVVRHQVDVRGDVRLLPQIPEPTGTRC